MKFITRFIWRLYVDAAVVTAIVRSCEWTADTVRQYRKGRKIGIVNGKPATSAELQAHLRKQVREHQSRLPTIEEQLDNMAKEV